MPLSIDAYFTRIGYSGSGAPTLDTLNTLIRLHTTTVPFENVDPVLGRRVHLSEEALERKLVHERRGGYCFEQNGFFQDILTALGYKVRSLGARVRFGRPRDYTPARTHLFGRVELDGEEWLVDVGIGGMSPTCAIRLHVEDEQPTPHEARRIVREGSRYFHQMRMGDEWHDLCEFTLDEMPPIDRELANWYTSTHPDSYFRNNIIAARALPEGGRLNLLNRELTRRWRDGSSEKRIITSHTDLRDTLEREFGLNLAPGTEIACPGLVWG